MDIKQEIEDIEDINEVEDVFIDCNIVKEEYVQYVAQEITPSHVKKSEFCEENTLHICNDCGKTLMSKSSLKRHLKTHNNTKFHCAHCTETFKSKNSLQVHLKGHSKYTNNPLPLLHNCNYCKRKFKDIIDLSAHITHRHESRKGINKCYVCAKKFVFSSSLHRHIDTFHKKDTDLKSDDAEKCPICGRQFKNKIRLQRHIAAHSRKKKLLECNICYWNFTQRLDLKKHIEMHHPENILICKSCDNVFKSEEDLKIHSLTHFNPTMDNKLQCPYCSSSYSAKKKYKVHVNKFHKGLPNIGDPPLKCTICKERFEKLDDLKTHVTIQYNSNRFYECAKCGQKILHKYSLRRHLLERHIKLKSRLSDDQLYHCFLCTKKFWTKSEIIKHMVHHQMDNLRRWKCEICCKRFKAQRDLSNHEITHIEFSKEGRAICTYCCKLYCRRGIKNHIKKFHIGLPILFKDGNAPVKCTVCKATYNNIDELKKHVNVHYLAKIQRVAKRFSCNICKEKFVRKLELYCHLSDVHDDKEIAKLKNSKLNICNTCGLTFEQNKILLKHEQQHIRRYELFSEQDINYFDKKKMLNEYLNTKHILPNTLASPSVTEDSAANTTAVAIKEEIDDSIYISD